MNTLEKYIDQFSRLRVDRKTGYPAPHKCILLLAIMNLVDSNKINEPRIYLTNELVQQFKLVWQHYLGEISNFSCNIAMPYYHMHSEPFWQLVPHAVANERGKSHICAEDNDFADLQKIEIQKCGHSVKAVRNMFAYADLDPQLFLFFKDKSSSSRLRLHLLKIYILMLENANNTTRQSSQNIQTGNNSSIIQPSINVFYGNDAIDRMMNGGTASKKEGAKKDEEYTIQTVLDYVLCLQSLVSEGWKEKYRMLWLLLLTDKGVENYIRKTSDNDFNLFNKYRIYSILGVMKNHGVFCESTTSDEMNMKLESMDKPNKYRNRISQGIGDKYVMGVVERVLIALKKS